MPRTISGRTLERIQIDFVEPHAEARRAPLRRLVGDSIPVYVDLACDGDAVLTACICYRVPHEPRWRYAPMRPDEPAHRWHGAVRLQSGGHYRIRVEAWVDVYATLRERALRALRAGTSAGDELDALGEALAASAAGAEGQDQELISTRAQAVRGAGDAQALEALCDRQLNKRMWMHGARLDMVRSAHGFDVVVERRRAGFAAWWIGAPPAMPGNPVAGESGVAPLAHLGFDVLCLPTPAHLVVGAPKRRAAARVSGKPDGDFAERIAQVRRLGMEVALDFHPLEAAGAAEAAGTADVAHETFATPSLWQGDRAATWQRALDELESWVQCGVHVFRVIAPEQQPLAFWSWCVERIKRRHPEVILVADGEASAIQEELLARAGLSVVWPAARWTGSRRTAALRLLADAEHAQRHRPHLALGWSESATTSKSELAARRCHTLLATMLSPTCAFRPTSTLGPVMQRDLQTLLRIRRENRALQLATNLVLQHCDNEHLLFFSRSLPDHRNDVLVVANLDAERVQEGRIDVPLAELGLDASRDYEVEDLLTGKRSTWRGARRSVRLDPRVQPGLVLRIVRPSRLGELL